MPGHQAQRPLRDRPFEALVVACSDGRFNEQIDETIVLLEQMCDVYRKV